MNDYFDQIERQLTARVAAGELPRGRWPFAMPSGGRPRGLPGVVVAAVSAAVVIAVVLVALGSSGDGGGDRSPSAGLSALDVSFAPVAPVSPARLESARAMLAARIAPVLPGASVIVFAGRIIIRGVTAARRAEVIALAGPGRLTLFDWEASVIGPNGAPIASGPQSGAALTLGQGVSLAQPGSAGAGGLPLALALARLRRAVARGRATPAATAQRPAADYLIGRAHTPACALAAATGGFTAPTRGSCLLAGPAADNTALRASLPDGVSAADGHEVVVPAGFALLQASTPLGSTLAAGDARARFFVVRGPVAMTGAQLSNPTDGSDQSGEPDVQFQFTPAGGRAFEAVTAAVAHRGQRVSAFHQLLPQHFAVAVDDRILTVPQIDFSTYPDGVTAGDGADIAGGFTRASAQALASVLARGPLPVALAPR